MVEILVQKKLLKWWVFNIFWCKIWEDFVSVCLFMYFFNNNYNEINY